MTDPWGSFGVPGRANRSNETEALLSYVARPPIAQLRQTTGQVIVNSGAFAPLTWHVADADSEIGWDATTNPSRYTPRKVGWYQVSGSCSWPSNGAGQRAAQWLVNGVAVAASQSSFPVAATGPIPQHPARTMLVLLGALDYVELGVFQDSGGSLTTSVANAQVQSCMTVRWVSL